MSEKIIIFDTTLRDGEQSPGASLNTWEKVEVARQLARLNVDVIEAGFPISSPGDFESVQLIAREIREPIICGLARTRPEDIDRCWEAVKEAEHPRIHTFIATSDVHLDKKLRKGKQEVIEIATSMVKRAKGYCEDVEFSPEDAARTSPEYLADVVEAVIEVGATTVNIPDTVGYSNPWEFGKLITFLFEKVKNIKQTVISVHCHNDLGLAVANSLAAVKAGARQVECCVNGIGERAGNCSLEEIVMNLHTRVDCFGVHTDIVTEEIYRTSRLVSKLTGISVQPNKAIVGGNAFAHEAGIHQDGVLKERTTYEIMSPDTVGWRGESMVLGRHSGRHGFRERLEELGFHLPQRQLEIAFAQFKELADKKKDIYDEDLETIVEAVYQELAEASSTAVGYRLEYFHTLTGSSTVPTAMVRLSRGDELFEATAHLGDGPISAVFKAIDNVTDMPLKLEDYSLRAVTRGKDALGEATVRVRKGDQTVTARGVSVDVIEASVKAYLVAVNRLLLQG